MLILKRVYYFSADAASRKVITVRLMRLKCFRNAIKRTKRLKKFDNFSKNSFKSQFQSSGRIYYLRIISMLQFVARNFLITIVSWRRAAF